MTHGDPAPRDGIDVIRAPWPFKVLRHVDLEIHPSAAQDQSFDDVLAARRSRRDIAASPALAVAAVIRQAFAISGVRGGRRRKTTISAGALHPIKCVFFRTGRDVIRYDDENDVFQQVGVRDEAVMSSLVERCRMTLPSCDGYWILFIADREITARSYEHPESLIWRDAGAALQTLALVAEARALAFCPLGILGGEAVTALLGDSDRFIAAGVAALGLRVG